MKVCLICLIHLGYLPQCRDYEFYRQASWLWLTGCPSPPISFTLVPRRVPSCLRTCGGAVDSAGFPGCMPDSWGRGSSPSRHPQLLVPEPSWPHGPGLAWKKLLPWSLCPASQAHWGCSFLSVPETLRSSQVGMQAFFLGWACGNRYRGQSEQDRNNFLFLENPIFPSLPLVFLVS